MMFIYYPIELQPIINQQKLIVNLSVNRQLRAALIKLFMDIEDTMNMFMAYRIQSWVL
jgi:hypothetical protein